MISTLAPSLIRTYVPILVGGLLSWLITLGVEVDETVEAGLIAALTGLLIAAYYTVVRLLEKKWPGLSILLGSNLTPAQYTEDGVAVITTVQAAPPQGYTGSLDPGAGNYPTA